MYDKATCNALLPPEEEVAFQYAITYLLCNEFLQKDRVGDHDHLTGMHRGGLHNLFNLKYWMRKVILVTFYNLKNFDAHLIMQGIE